MTWIFSYLLTETINLPWISYVTSISPNLYRLQIVKWFMTHIALESFHFHKIQVPLVFRCWRMILQIINKNIEMQSCGNAGCLSITLTLLYYYCMFDIHEWLIISRNLTWYFHCSADCWEAGVGKLWSYKQHH